MAYTGEIGTPVKGSNDPPSYLEASGDIMDSVDDVIMEAAENENLHAALLFAYQTRSVTAKLYGLEMSEDDARQLDYMPREQLRAMILSHKGN